MATTSRVSAGLMFSKVWPVVDSTHSPSMKFLKIRDFPTGAVPREEVSSEVAIAIRSSDKFATLQSYALGHKPGKSTRQAKNRGSGNRRAKRSFRRSIRVLRG